MVDRMVAQRDHYLAEVMAERLVIQKVWMMVKHLVAWKVLQLVDKMVPTLVVHLVAWMAEQMANY